MALVEKAELYYPKLDPANPNKKFKPENPTWEIQIRTTDKAVKKEWEALNLSVKAIVPDEGEAYYRVNLKKNSISQEGTPNDPVKVVDMKLKPVDPKTLGNGSICIIRIYQRPYTSKTGQPAVQSILMGVQVVEHVLYEYVPRDDEFKSEDDDGKF
jgi:hypothetical protein